MGRSSKKNKSKRQSDESDKLAVKSKRKKLQEFTVTKSSPRKSTSGMWQVVKVTPSEPETEKEPSEPETEKESSEFENSLNQKSSTPVMTTTTLLPSSPPAVVECSNNTGSECFTSPDTHHENTAKTDVIRQHSTFQREKTEESGHRKRNYRETNKNVDDSTEFKRSKISERNGREYDRSRSEGRHRSDRDRPQWQRMHDIGGGQPHYTRDRSFERRSVEIKPQRPKHSFHRLKDRKEALVLLKHPTDIVLWGKAEVQVIWGSVTVLGYTMTHTSLERWPVYSPSCNSYIKIHTLSSEGSPATDLCRNAVEQYVGTSMDRGRLKVLLAAIEEKSVIVSIKKLEEKYLEFICSISPFQNLFPKVSEPDPVEEEPLHNLGVTVSTDQSVAPIEISFEMKSVQQELLSLLEDGQNPVIAVCGGKNVGKSTMGRFLTNTVLNHRKEVAFLECDVGQTEFTPPACIALNIVRQPLLGPPFTHQRKPERVCFLGAVTPADDPGRYLRCLKYVYEAYRCLPEKPVLIVNTMGWNKGLGLTFMADTLRMISPTLVVQINCWGSEGRNYPTLNTTFVHNTPSWWQNQYCDSSNQTNSDYHHRLITLDSSVDVRPKTATRYEPLDYRNLALLAHFGHMYDPLTFPEAQPPALETLRPYKVPWSLFALHVCHAAVPNSQIMNVLNGSVVALCHVSESDILETTSEGLPDFLRESPVCNCLGLGVIRSIDPVEKCFFILTQLCQSDLSKVNCLLKGSLDLPRQILMTQPADKNGMIPYVGEPMDLIGAFAISRRRHLQRRRTAAAD